MTIMLPSAVCRRRILLRTPRRHMGVQQITITLPDDIADLVRAKVASGEYASESDIVQDGIESLFSKDAQLESWLMETVASAYDRLRMQPESAVNVDHVRSRIEAMRG